MKTLIRLLVFLNFTFSFAQEHFKFYLEIPNENIISNISDKRNGTINLTFSEARLNRLFSNYNIYNFEKAFPDAQTPKLQNVYYVESDNENLKNILLESYSLYFTYAEKISDIQLLYTPTDYIYSGDFLNSKNLDLINVKEAWDYSKGDSDFIIGISDHLIYTDHEDLKGKANSLYPYSFESSHGTQSAGTAAAITDNALGIAGVGFNSSVLGARMSVSELWKLYQNGARVVNASWGGCSNTANYNPNGIEPLAIDEMHANGVVIVASAGNGLYSNCNPDNFYFPASYKNVISVTSIGTQDVGFVAQHGSMAGFESNIRDRVEKRPGYPESRFQTNSEVDIAAPGFDSFATVIPLAANNYGNYGLYGGTSASAPHVSGAISLMLTANTCLNSNEVESLLKLTSVKLDSISTNVPYIGKMGAGRMDVGKATKAAWQMNSLNGGELLLKNRTFNRWHFELLNSPEYIRLKNEQFIENSDIVFKAKKGITLDVNTLLEPGLGKSHYLYVENTDSCFMFNKSYDENKINKKLKPSADIPKLDIKIFPNPVENFINIQTKEEISKASLFSADGKKIIETTNVKKNVIDISHIPKGNYILKINILDQDRVFKVIKK